MFGKTKYPLETIEKVNIEYHLDWLFRRYGETPIHDFTTLTAKSREVAGLVSRSGEIDRSTVVDLIASRFPFDCNGCELIDWDGESQVPADWDVILLNPDEQVNIGALISRVACHLAGRYLVSVDFHESGRLDQKILMEFLPVYFGLGVFCANFALKTTQFSDGDMHFWHHQKYTDTAARHFGTALAYLTWIRRDPSEHWSRVLRPDARVPYRKAVRYLMQTNDSLFHPSIERSVFAEKDISILVGQIPEATAGSTFGILDRIDMVTDGNSLEQNDHQLGGFAAWLPDLLRNNDPSIRLKACQLAKKFGVVEGETLGRLKDLWFDSQAEIRQEAIEAAVYLAPQGQLLCSDLRIPLKDHDDGVVEAAIKGLLFLQQADERIVPGLLGLIRRTMNDDRTGNLTFILGALDTVSANAEEHLTDFFQGEDVELEIARRCLRDWRTSASRPSVSD